MAQRLIICTDSAKGLINGANAQERNQITRLLEGKEWAVWHWFEDVWLVAIPNGSVDTKVLRAEITALVGPLKHVLVMDVGDGEIVYSGLGPPAGWPWMAANWGDAEIS